MADVVKLSYQEVVDTAKSLRTEAESARTYIQSQVTNEVNNMSSWWVGQAYEAFKSDFNKTKTVFTKQIIDEIITYANNLEKAALAQKVIDDENRKITQSVNG